MKYLLYFEIGRDVTYNDCWKMDTLNAGASYGIGYTSVEWRNVPAHDVERALDFIMLEYGHVFVEVAEERPEGVMYHGEETETPPICGVKL